jgi:putative FmdB family regulatory protein
MPIYEYKCENGHVFDVMQRMSDDPLTACVDCGATVRKVLHPVGISFKGSGFYSTDYSTKAPKTEFKETAKTGDSSNGSSGKNGSSEGSEKTTKAADKKSD